MKKLLIAIAAVLVTAATYGQGQVAFANRVGAAGLDAPVKVLGTENGPGSSYSAQLFLVGAGGALTPLTPATTFFDATPTAPTRSQYWQGQTVTVPGISSGDAQFRVRAWQTAAGGYEQASAPGSQWGFGESADFTAAVTLAPNPPGNLVNLQPFTVTVVPEPSVIALGVLGAAALLLRRKKQ
jgi:hypothetical protein